MRFIRLSGLFACSVLLGACYPQNWQQAGPLYIDPDETPFSFGPYLVRTGDEKMAVVVRAPELRRPPELRYSVIDDESKAQQVTAELVDGLWVAEMTALPVSTPLKYEIFSEAGGFGPARFRSGRKRGEAFRFAAFGDTRTGHEVHRALVEAMAREEIDFVVHSGDLVEFGGVDAEWSLFFQIEGPLMSRVPLFASVGNHDTSPRGQYRRFFLRRRSSQNRTYVYRDWGDVRVVLMDSTREARPASAQHNFVEEALRDGAAKGMILVISLHHPPYSSGSHGSHYEMREIVGELAARYGVELVLAGHDHNYERTKAIDGVTYMVAASGGATIRPMTVSSFTAAQRTEPHYVLFDVDRGSLAGRAISLNGSVFDSFVIPENPPRGRARAPQAARTN